MSAFDNFLKVQKHYESKLVDRVGIGFDRSGYSMEGIAIE
jgi:hypothetical protein